MRINYRISPSFCLWTWASNVTGSLATMIQTYVLWQTPILKHLRLPTKETLSTRGKRESVSHSWPQPKPKVSVHFSRFPENQTAQKAKYDEMHETHFKSETKWQKYMRINTGKKRVKKKTQTFELGKELRRECVVWEASVAETLRSPKTAIFRLQSLCSDTRCTPRAFRLLKGTSFQPFNFKGSGLFLKKIKK